MKFSQTNSSSLRYFLARFKPFGNFLFWGPLTILGLLCFGIWQYQTHPEWLSNSSEPLQTLEESFIESQNTVPNNSLSTFDPNSQPVFPSSNNPNPRSSLLQKPNNPPNSNDPSKSSLIEPSVLPSLKSEGSLFESTSIKPVKPSPLIIENHLQKALNNQTNLNNSNQNSPPSSESLPELNINNRSSSSNHRASGQQNNNNYPQPVQPSIQPYQVPYNDALTQVQPQQIQPPSSSFQVPYSNSNYPNQPQRNTASGQSNPTGQGTSVPSNTYSRPPAQIQPSVQSFPSY